jgi:hypothetical protein
MNKVNVISVNSKGEPIIETIEVDKNTLKIDPYELIAPKIYATVFGLTAEDNLDEI